MSKWLPLTLSLALMGQWFGVHHLAGDEALVVALAAGAGIFGAALALSWAAEVAQLDIPAALAFAFLAFVAVLPEYAVDIYFAWQAGTDPAYVSYATANMTGANRILIGVGWPVVILAYWWRSSNNHIELSRGQNTELRYLLFATVYSFVIPLKGTLSVVDTVVLSALFLAYLSAVARSEVIEPELGGPAEQLGRLAPLPRRLATVFLFAAAGVTIFAAAEPFAEALLEVGAETGIEKFVLVQWLAPLASETPEFIVAVIFALKLKPQAGFATLLSSKVNQWTLLIGALPVAFSLSAGEIGPLVLDHRQNQEILLTAAQSLFAVVLICGRRFSAAQAGVLAFLFIVQLVWPDPLVRRAFVVVYLAGAVVLGLGATRRKALGALVLGRA